MAQKKYSQPPKKVPLGFRGFRTSFLLLATPYLMFKIKKKNQILIEFLDGTKKLQLAAKKSFLVAKKSSPRVQRISYIIFAVDHPLCDNFLLNSQMAQKKSSQPPKKVSQSAKKVPLGFRGFHTSFLLLTTPYVMFEIKKNSNSY